MTTLAAFHVRAATAADVDAITAIYRPAVEHGTASFELEAPDAEEMARRMLSLLDGGFPYLVAVDRAGTVHGYAYAGPYRPRPAYRHTVEGSIYIAPTAQRRGLGRLLLAALVEEATRRGFRQMVAVIGDSAQQASLGLHRAMGFRFCGVVHSVGFKHGRWLDQVLMQRPLGAGDTTAP
jgi:L-amino acid N-acyltransferase YncA